MVCSDGVEVQWAWCDSPGTTLTSKEVLALADKNKDAATRLVAHAHLTRTQIKSLYTNGGKSIANYGLLKRLTGKRILQSGLFDYCRGIGEQRLMSVYCKAHLRADKKLMLKALLTLT